MLMMWKTLRDLSPMLEEYGDKLSRDPAFPSLMLSTVGEMKASSLTPSMLERAAKKTSDELLTRKLRDLALIHASFDGLVSMSFEDSADDLTHLATILEKHPFFRSSKVYIDGFTSFTVPELSVIRHIFAQADDTTVTLPLPSPRAILLYSSGINRSETALLRAAEENGEVEIVYLAENHRAESEPLRYLSKNLWDLAHMIDPVRLRFEFNNPDTNLGNYSWSPLGHGKYRPDALFATVMAASPLAWMELSDVSDKSVAALSSLVKVWKRERERWYGGVMHPAGGRPDGVAWTGFVSESADGAGGYALLFRELNQSKDFTLDLSGIFGKGFQADAKIIAGRGEASL
jgi:hypothetical protein